MSSKTSSRPRSGPPTGNVSNGKPNAWSRPLQPKQQSAPPGMGAPLVLRERFLHLTLNMVGHKVVLTKTNGSVVEGIFHTFTPFSSTDMKYVLKACKGDGVETGATIILDAADVAQVWVKSMRLDTTSKTSDGFQTDVQISATKNDKNRDLVAAGSAWTTAGGNSRAEGLAGDRSKGLKGDIGGWDQFKANEELFNVQATFDENLYTTELDHSQIDSRKKMEAARLAKEIETTTSSNIHIAEERGQALEGDYDEEDRYSGVLKPSLQPRNVDPKSMKQPVKPVAQKTPKAGAKKEDTVSKDAGEAKSTRPKKMNYAAAAAKAKADAKAAIPPGFVKPGTVTPEEGVPMKKDEKKEEENGEGKPVPVTPAEGEAKKEEKSDDKKGDEAKDSEKTEEKKKPATKLNANAKSFSFNPSAKSFTPSFGGAPPAAVPPVESYPMDPNTGMPMGGPGAPQMPPQYMHHPGMAQPGMVQMMNPHFAMRYPSGPYPGMEHQMPMQVPQYPQHMQPQPPSAPGSQQPSAPGSTQPSEQGSVTGESPVPPGADELSEGGSAAPPPQQPLQQPGQPVQQMPYGGGPPNAYYPGMMPPPRGGPGGYPHPSQMAPPGGNPYAHPMYGGPMPMGPNMMRGPQGNYYPPMGGMHYPPGTYGGGMMDDDQGYRGGRGPAGRGRGGPRRQGSGGRGKGGRSGGRGYNSYSSGGGSGRQTPQSTTSGLSDSGEGGESKKSSSPIEEAQKPSGGEEK